MDTFLIIYLVTLVVGLIISYFLIKMAVKNANAELLETSKSLVRLMMLDLKAKGIDETRIKIAGGYNEGLKRLKYRAESNGWNKEEREKAKKEFDDSYAI